MEWHEYNVNFENFDKKTLEKLFVDFISEGRILHSSGSNLYKHGRLESHIVEYQDPNLGGIIAFLEMSATPNIAEPNSHFGQFYVGSKNDKLAEILARRIYREKRFVKELEATV